MLLLRSLSRRSLSRRFLPRRRAAALVLAAFGAGLAAPAARAQTPPNLVVNGDFEYGNMSGWTPSGNTASTGVDRLGGGYQPHGGSFFALLGPEKSDGFLTQTLATTPGGAYDIRFFFASNGAGPSDFSASFGGVPLLALTNPASTHGWVLFDFTATAAGDQTPLTFGFRDDPNFLALDDVTVTPLSPPVPEASTTASFGLLLTLGAILRMGGLVVAAKRRKA